MYGLGGLVGALCLGLAFVFLFIAIGLAVMFPPIGIPTLVAFVYGLKRYWRWLTT